MKIRKPVIIIGVERSGKTLLSCILAHHPDLYSLSKLDSLWPTGTIPVTLARRICSWIKPGRIHTVIPGTFSKTRGGLPPSECTAYWKKVFGWGDEENYLIEDDYSDERDLTAELRERLLNDLSLRVSLSGKARLMMEQAGFSLKMRFFNALFPDAIFLHVIRNPFDNHEALVQAKLNSRQKLWGVKIPGWKELIGEDPGKQAEMQMKAILRIIDEDIVKIPSFETRFMRIRYEDLVSAPQESIQKVLNFCDLNMTPRILASLSGVKGKTKDQHDPSYPRSRETLDVLGTLAYEYGY